MVVGTAYSSPRKTTPPPPAQPPGLLEEGTAAQRTRRPLRRAKKLMHDGTTSALLPSFSPITTRVHQLLRLQRECIPGVSVSPGAIDPLRSSKPPFSKMHIILLRALFVPSLARSGAFSDSRLCRIILLRLFRERAGQLTLVEEKNNTAVINFFISTAHCLLSQGSLPENGCTRAPPLAFASAQEGGAAVSTRGSLDRCFYFSRVRPFP